MLSGIESYIVEHKIMDKVTFTGKIPRNQIINYLDKAECFAMLSQGEAFGLVYLEAMSRGCITVAAKNEGVDGIIIDGENGFLCNAGDSDEFASVIARINAMTPEQRKKISEKGRATVAELTDKKVARMYLRSVEQKSRCSLKVIL